MSDLKKLNLSNQLQKAASIAQNARLGSLPHQVIPSSNSPHQGAGWRLSLGCGREGHVVGSMFFVGRVGWIP